VVTVSRPSGEFESSLIAFNDSHNDIVYTVHLQAKNSDPSRLFNARGGQLLKDQQLQGQVKKELGKLERSLNHVLSQWEEDCERHFIVMDNRYLDTIATQWEESGKIKEKEKAKRVSVDFSALHQYDYLNIPEINDIMSIVILEGLFCLNEVLKFHSKPCTCNRIMGLIGGAYNLESTASHCFCLFNQAKENKVKTELEMTYGSKPSTPLKKILK